MSKRNISFREYLRIKRLCVVVMRKNIPGCPHRIASDERLKSLFDQMLKDFRETYRKSKTLPHSSRLRALWFGRRGAEQLCRDWIAHQLFGVPTSAVDASIETGFDDLDNETILGSELLPTGIPEVDQNPDL